MLDRWAQPVRTSDPALVSRIILVAYACSFELPVLVMLASKSQTTPGEAATTNSASIRIPAGPSAAAKSTS